MGYYIDIQNISTEKYSDILKSADLLPSRAILKNNVEKNFGKIKNAGVANLKEYLERTKNKKKQQEFSEQSGVDEDYLTILTRKIKSYRQPPCKLKDFPEIPNEIISALAKKGLTNTLQLFDKVLTPESRKMLSNENGISEEWVLKLACLTDLCRIRWVNHTFAFILLQTGYNSAKSIAGANVVEVHNKVNQFIEEKGLFKIRIGQHDIKLCVEAAKDLTFEINF